MSVIADVTGYSLKGMIKVGTTSDGDDIVKATTLGGLSASTFDAELGCQILKTLKPLLVGTKYEFFKLGTTGIINPNDVS